jgi:hypothetical protein
MLEWGIKSDNRMSYDDAVLYCAFCTYGCYNDWRLLTKPEYDDADLYQSDVWYLDDALKDDSDGWYVVPVRDI